MRQLAALFLAGHGWVHGVMWALPYSAEARADLPMDPAHSWLIGDARAFGLAFGIATAVAFMVAAGAVLMDAGWWPWAVIVASVLSVVLMALFFSPWWGIGFAIDAVLLVVAWRALG